ncbi:TPA: isocitrate dehydrogenase [Klebsiella pneumoniae]
MKLFINDLTVIDFSFLDAESGLIGDSLIVDIILEGDLNAESMVMDFSHAKKSIKHEIDKLADHVLIVPEQNSHIIVSHAGTTTEVAMLRKNGETQCFISGPQESFWLVQTDNINSRCLESQIEKHLLACLPQGVKDITITLRPESINGDSYHYSHGLKKHRGNCQRIAHGHRSAIRIFVDGERSHMWEQKWATRWNNAYLLSREDVVTVTTLSPRAVAYWHKGLTCSSWRSSQGYFEIMLCSEVVDILPCDTTVESLALFIRQSIEHGLPAAKIEVHAFEGVGKGAIA